MRNYLFILIISAFATSCATDGLIDDSKREEALSYKNGTLSTGKVSTTGLNAPAGFEFSEIPAGSEGMLLAYYLDWTEAAKSTVSDDFTVPPNESWKIENFSFYIMNPDVLATSVSSIKTVVLEVYDGDPRLTTSKKVYGNMNDNVFKSIAPTNIYRISNLTTYTSTYSKPKQVYKVETDITGLNLLSGKYWFKMTFKFNYGDDWFWFVPRLPVAGNDVSSFNAYFRLEKTGDIFTADPGNTDTQNPVQPPTVKFETPFEITGIKTIN